MVLSFRSAVTTVTVSVINENDSPPHFIPTNSINVTVAEDVPVGSMIHILTVSLLQWRYPCIYSYECFAIENVNTT